MQGNWFKGLRRWCTGTCVVLAIGTGVARAGDNDADLKRMLEQQSKQIEELKKRLDAAEATRSSGYVSTDGAAPAAKDKDKEGTDPIKKIVDSYLKEKDEKKKADDEAKKAKEEQEKACKEAEGYKVGSDLGMTVKWETVGNSSVQAQQGPRFSTANGDFNVHMGFRFMYDVVAWDQSPLSRLPSQLGNLEDGTYFRRIRPYFDGKFWEVGEFTCELQVEQVRQGIVQLDEVFAGLTQIPYVGTIRVGHMRIPQGVEGDQISSSKVMTFMEKSSMTDAIFQNQNFAPGIWTGNSVLDQRVTWAAMLYRQELALHDSIGADFGDGKYGATGRVTCLPLWEDDGRYLVHLGLSGTWRKAEDPDVTGATSAAAVGLPAAGGVVIAPPGNAIGPGVVRFRARPEQRDATGDYGNDILGGNGAITALPGNANRLVDTGNIVASGTSIVAGEFISIMGPFSLVSEWGFASALGAQVNLNPFNARIPATPLQRVGNLTFNGGYVTASYILTGENRLYDRRLGRFASNYLVPNTNFWFVEERDSGHWLLGRGAWEVAARFSYLNLNDGPVQGGVMTGVTLGLNWYINPNLKVQFEYIHDSRFDRLGGNPVGAGNILTTGTPGNLSETVDGFGMRTQFYF